MSTEPGPNPFMNYCKYFPETQICGAISHHQTGDVEIVGQTSLTCLNLLLMEEILYTPVKVGTLSHYLLRVFGNYIPGGDGRISEPSTGIRVI